MKNGMKIVLSLSLILCSLCAKGQQVAVKTNLVYDALLTVNLGVEVGLAPRWTLDVSGNYNGWTLSHDRRWKHWLVQPEARYWFCDRFAGHFLGMHLRRTEKRRFVSRHRFLETFRPPLSGLVHRCGRRLRLRVDSGHALESGGGAGRGVDLHAFRQLSVRQVRAQAR